MLLDLERFFEGTQNTPLESHHKALRDVLTASPVAHGRIPEWDEVVKTLKATPSTNNRFYSDTVRIGDPQPH